MKVKNRFIGITSTCTGTVEPFSHLIRFLLRHQSPDTVHVINCEIFYVVSLVNSLTKLKNAAMANLTCSLCTILYNFLFPINH